MRKDERRVLSIPTDAYRRTFETNVFGAIEAAVVVNAVDPGWAPRHRLAAWRA